jgi:hypothetical protein
MQHTEIDEDTDTQAVEFFCDFEGEYVQVVVVNDDTDAAMENDCPDCGKGMLFRDERDCDEYHRDMEADRRFEEWREQRLMLRLLADPDTRF